MTLYMPVFNLDVRESALDLEPPKLDRLAGCPALLSSLLFGKFLLSSCEFLVALGTLELFIKELAFLLIPPPASVISINS